MSQKQAKKFRKLLRKEVEKLASEKVEREMNMFKKKPKLIPMWIWVRLIGIFIKVKKTKTKKHE
jgi:hypothetical protein